VDVKDHTVAIIVAGGSGKRMGGAIRKQFLEIQGKSILIHTLEKFDKAAGIKNVILVVPIEDIETSKILISQWGIQKVLNVIPGGQERQDSVRNGLEAVPENTAFVAIHDGVRPFISSGKIDELIEETKIHGAVIPVLPVSDTVHHACQDGCMQTDDAALVERLGHPVHAIPGEVTNIKITTSWDLNIAETISKK